MKNEMAEFVEKMQSVKVLLNIVLGNCNEDEIKNLVANENYSADDWSELEEDQKENCQDDIALVKGINDLVGAIIDRGADIAWKQYQALLKVGFGPDQAIQIVANQPFKITTT